MPSDGIDSATREAKARHFQSDYGVPYTRFRRRRGGVNAGLILTHFAGLRRLNLDPPPGRFGACPGSPQEGPARVA
jgi:hypothetical protein